MRLFYSERILENTFAMLNSYLYSYEAIFSDFALKLAFSSSSESVTFSLLFS